MQFDILTLFPNLVEPYLKDSILARAIRKKNIKVRVHNVRDWTKDKHHTVDDAPYGGGPGMVLKVDVWLRALKAVIGAREIKKRLDHKRFENWKLKIGNSRTRHKTRIVLLDPAGKKFSQAEAQRYATKYKRLVLLAGRYEGFDARLLNVVDERISVGPYVLSGGELPALTIVEATARLLPGVLGNPKSLESETLETSPDYPVYTRPEKFSPTPGLTWRVPHILLSGHAQKIATWRKKHQKQTRS